MRNRFPPLNETIDNGNGKDLNALLEESRIACATIMADASVEERERFTYVSMIHAALYHHKKKANESSSGLPDSFPNVMDAVEQAMTQLADSIGVEHRFLSVFYLFYNPEIPDVQGTFAQFRPSNYETAFLRVNREGTLQYKLAANALFETYGLMHRGPSSFESITSLLQTAANAFHKISLGNAMLLKTPGGEEFKFLTQYFGEVQIGGRSLRGVNAGDQPWSYIIDLVLGVDLKQVFQLAFVGTPSERSYIANAKTSAEVIAYEFRSSEYLHEKYLLPEDYTYLMTVIEKMTHHPASITASIATTFSPEQQLLLAGQLHQVVKQYVAASNVHFQLAKRFVPANSLGEQIGSAGTNIVRFLKDGLNAAREKVRDKLELQYPALLKPSKTDTIPA
jgi:hypothetical protein